jgi:hypothetical protein
VSEQAHCPEEIVYFRSHWDLLTLLRGLLRLRPALTLICPPGRGMSSPPEDRIAALMRTYGHDGVTGPMVADFFHAWRESQAPGDHPSFTPDTCFSLTPKGQACLSKSEERRPDRVAAPRKETPADEVAVP